MTAHSEVRFPVDDGVELGAWLYEQALEPKKLVLIPGGHFDAYRSEFEISCGAAVDWFRQRLDA